MCGIVGLISAETEKALFESASELQSHRGPDARGHRIVDSGQWKVHLSHQRLSIIDLDEGASQPFLDSTGKYLISYNGEIYNYIEIRQELEKNGVVFRTSSDTEVLLEAIVYWGLEKTLQMANGMFAFLLLDIEAKKLLVARDRFGIKPLYYIADGTRITFASEIKSCLRLWKKRVGVNEVAVANYLRQNLLETDSELTFFEGVKKVLPGHCISIELKEAKIELKYSAFYELKIKSNESIGFEEACIEYRRLLTDATDIRLRSDVPVGIMLSGGIDSSVLASLAVDRCRRDGKSVPRLLSVVSDDPSNDESPFIDEMASYLKLSADKIQLDVDPGNFFTLMREAHWYNDEPLTSFSAIGHFEMMRRASLTDAKVLLCGQGADEALGGYKKYIAFAAQSYVRQGSPLKGMKLIFDFYRNGSIINDYSLKDAKRYLPNWMKPSNTSVLGRKTIDVPGCALGLNGHSFAGRSKLDIEKFSVPVLLHIEDRLSMAFGREIRVPFLDHRLVEFTLGLPTEMKVGSGWTKQILRHSFVDQLPPMITWRRDKKGFTLPQDQWLKGALRDTVLDIFNSDALIYQKQLVDQKAMTGLLNRYLNGSVAENWGISYKDIFSPLSLEIWLQQYEEFLL